jgi:predicted alpha/beta-fold hydrolase
MPVRYSDDFRSPAWLPNGHFQSIYPALFRTIKNVRYRRERVITPDQDFLDLDWAAEGPLPAKGLVILSHGLEGNSTRQYILGMVRVLVAHGYHCLAWNFRSCSGELNLQARFYHSGATDDLHFVIQHALQKGYTALHLMGFSLGGNLTLKYLGEAWPGSDHIRKAVVFSVPMDLLACSRAIEAPQNKLYLQRFLKSLKPKVASKAALFPEQIRLDDYKRVKTFFDFDDIYTGPLHGFAGAEEYYARCSSRFFVDKIQVPTLIVNAQNDPMVPYTSLPIQTIEQLPNVQLELTREGGHCGFKAQPAPLRSAYWSEYRALRFLEE